MLRRLHHEQPESFAFTPANRAWAEAQVTKYPQGRQASAVIPLLWRAQEQEGWLSRAAIEHVADMLEMDYIRALEVATFYFMFQLQPVGSIAHIQICGTTSCMICGAEDLVGVCRAKIAPHPHELSADGRFSWEEVECLGACANAPMAQIGKDYYEDLTTERLEWILDELAAGRVPPPGPQAGRFASEPASGLTSLDGGAGRAHEHNASVAYALELGDTIKRIDGSETPLVTPWLQEIPPRESLAPAAKPGRGEVIDETGVTVMEAPAKTKAKPEATAKGAEAQPGRKPELLKAAREGGADDLKKINGVGPKLEKLLNGLGVFHFDQIAQWGGEEITWIDAHMDGFRGRAQRDDWVRQARKLGQRSGRKDEKDEA
jgi:NADH-quinone oxidoreductase subunit E